MERVFCIQILFLALTTGCIRSSSKNKVCSCCTATFTSIDSARYCIKQTPILGTSADPRLFLIAFVKKDLVTNQKAGWNILKDQDIVNVAKRNYVLLILDPKEFKISHRKDAPEMVEKMKHCQEDIFFVIANQALWPYSEWQMSEKKNIIIDRLHVGSGP
jgi:hypothetical protein